VPEAAGQDVKWTAVPGARCDWADWDMCVQTPDVCVLEYQCGMPKKKSLLFVECGKRCPAASGLVRVWSGSGLGLREAGFVRPKHLAGHTLVPSEQAPNKDPHSQRP